MLRKLEPLNQMNVKRLVIVIRPNKRHMLRIALPSLDPIMLNGLINRFSGHVSVRGPFTARNRQKTVGARGDEVVADQGGGVFGFGVRDERSDAGPVGEDVFAADFDLCRQRRSDISPFRQSQTGRKTPQTLPELKYVFISRKINSISSSLALGSSVSAIGVSVVPAITAPCQGST